MTDAVGDISIQKMDDEGGYLTSYVYISGRGWCTGMTPIEDGLVTFKEGEAICVDNEYGEPVYFNVSGEVDLVNKNEITDYYVLWGNSTPVTVDLKNVSIVDADGEPISDVTADVSLQKMDDEGGYLTSYVYISGRGWCTGMTPIEADTIMLKPGESVCVDNEYGETVYFKLPCPVK